MAGSIPRDGRQGEGVLPLTPHAPHSPRPYRSHGLPAVPRHDDVRPAVRRERPRRPSSTARSPAASPSSIPRTSTRWAASSTRWGGRRRSSAAGCNRGGRDVIVATKCFGADEPAAVGPRVSRASTSSTRSTARCAACAPTTSISTRRHHPDPDTPIDETLRALDDVVRAGKARYVGCSNYHAYQVARALGRSELLGLARFDCVQPRYNLLFRQPERELLPLCREEGVGVIPYNPIAGGSALRQAPARGRTHGGHAVHAGQRRAALPGALLARAGVRHDRGAPPAGRRGGHAAGATGDRRGCWPTPPSRRRSSARADPSSSMTCWRRRTRIWTRG